MLSRPATRITLTPDDILAYEQRKAARDAQKQFDMSSSQHSNNSTVTSDVTIPEKQVDSAPPTQTRAARVKQSREQRIGVGSSRG